MCAALVFVRAVLRASSSCFWLWKQSFVVRESVLFGVVAFEAVVLVCESVPDGAVRLVWARSGGVGVGRLGWVRLDSVRLGWG